MHPIQAESERNIWAVYLMDFRRPATHSSDAWNCEEAAKTLDCNIRIELSLPANATVSAVCQALKYCYSTRSVSDACIRTADCGGRTAEEILEDLNMADDSPDRLKAANPYIAHVTLEDRNSNSSTWCVYVRDPRWPADRCSGLYGEDDRWRESLRKKTGTGRGKCFKNDCNGRICVTLPPMETMRDVCEKLNRRCSIYSILSISSAPVYDLLCLVENNASDDEDLSRAIRASQHIRNLFPDVEVIQKMRLSRQRTEQIVVDYLFENTNFR